MFIQKLVILYTAATMIFLTSCLQSEEKKDTKPASEENVFLLKALEAAGGSENWDNIKRLSFTKETKMYLPDSSVEMQSLQRQVFSNHPEFRGEITYLEDSLNRRILHENGQLSYFEGEIKVLDEDKITRAKTAMRTAYYVIALPFKLRDNGVNLKATGNTFQEETGEVNYLEVSHDGKLDEKWWLYFDQETQEMDGYMIFHDNRYSYIVNDSLTNVNGFPFPLERRSMAMDSLQQNKYLRASYVYSDIKIE